MAKKCCTRHVQAPSTLIRQIHMMVHCRRCWSTCSAISVDGSLTCLEWLFLVDQHVKLISILSVLVEECQSTDCTLDILCWSALMAHTEFFDVFLHRLCKLLLENCKWANQSSYSSCTLNDGCCWVLIYAFMNHVLQIFGKF